MMKKKLVIFSVEKEAPHSDYLRYGSTFFFLLLLSAKTKFPTQKLLPKKTTDQECLKSLTQGTLPFFPSHTRTPPRAGHDLASTLLYIKLFLGYIE